MRLSCDAQFMKNVFDISRRDYLQHEAVIEDDTSLEDNDVCNEDYSSNDTSDMEPGDRTMDASINLDTKGTSKQSRWRH